MKGKLKYCGNSIEKILGYSVEEVLGNNFWQLTEEKEFNIDNNHIFKEGDVYIKKLKCKNGTYKYIQWTDFKYSEDLFIANGQDITQKINLEKNIGNWFNMPEILFMNWMKKVKLFM